jgi:hypothetical protein
MNQEGLAWVLALFLFPGDAHLASPQQQNQEPRNVSFHV